MVRRTYLESAGSLPELEILETDSASDTALAPIVCIHGAFAGAWMWEDFFLPSIAQRGRRGIAFSFRGHGSSQGKQKLREATLSDYSDDLLRVLTTIEEPPIIVAHSLGALLAQRLIGYVRIKALVMLAPLPPDGLALITPRLFLTQPSLWRSLQDVVAGSAEEAFVKVERLIFSDHLPRPQRTRYLPQMVMEGMRVLIESHVPFPVIPAYLSGVPTLILGGDEDRLVSNITNRWTALYHGAEYRSLAGRGHVPQLEPGAEELAVSVVDWLEARNL